MPVADVDKQAVAAEFEREAGRVLPRHMEWFEAESDLCTDAPDSKIA